MYNVTWYIYPYYDRKYWNIHLKRTVETRQETITASNHLIFLYPTELFNDIITLMSVRHVHLTRYIKLWLAYAPGMTGMFTPPPTSQEAASLWSWHASWPVRHGRSWHPRRMHNHQFYVSVKKPIHRQIISIIILNLLFPGESWNWCIAWDWVWYGDDDDRGDGDDDFVTVVITETLTFLSAWPL